LSGGVSREPKQSTGIEPVLRPPGDRNSINLSIHRRRHRTHRRRHAPKADEQAPRLGQTLDTTYPTSQGLFSNHRSTGLSLENDEKLGLKSMQCCNGKIDCRL